MYPYFSEQVMCWFDYLHIILKHPSKFAPPTNRHIDLIVILDDFENHLVLVEYCIVLAQIHWTYANNYMTWFYMMSHHIVTLDVLRRAHKSAVEM